MNKSYIYISPGFPSSACNAGDPRLIPGSGRFPGEGISYPLQCSWASLVAQEVNESACTTGDLGLIPGLGSSHREGKGYPLQYSGLENSTDWYSPWGCKKSDRAEFHFHWPLNTAEKDNFSYFTELFMRVK